jgi:hypothetical protein
MATLDSSNISNGNTIEPNDLLQLYDAFDYENSSTKYNVSLSGSLDGNATTATDATNAGSAVQSRLVAGDFSVRGAAEENALFFPIAGTATVSSQVATSATFTALDGLELGTDVFITANYILEDAEVRAIKIESITGNQILFDCSGSRDGDVLSFIALVLGSL